MNFQTHKFPNSRSSSSLLLFNLKMIEFLLIFTFFKPDFFFPPWPTPHGLWDLSSQPGIKPWLLAVKAWSPNHLTTREFPCYLFLIILQKGQKNKKEHNLTSHLLRNKHCQHLIQFLQILNAEIIIYVFTWILLTEKKCTT